jgi:hypothetical protein
MAHKFNVGQIVELEPRLRRLSDPGPYEIRHLFLPRTGTLGDPCYRIKGIAESRPRLSGPTKR